MARKENMVKLICILFWVLIPNSSLPASDNIPWSSRHFPNAPRISAEQALSLKNAGQKMVIIDVPWSQQGFKKSHICGAIPMRIDVKKMDRLIKKIPKDYIILSY